LQTAVENNLVREALSSASRTSSLQQIATQGVVLLVNVFSLVKFRKRFKHFIAKDKNS